MLLTIRIEPIQLIVLKHNVVLRTKTAVVSEKFFLIPENESQTWTNPTAVKTW